MDYYMNKYDYLCQVDGYPMLGFNDISEYLDDVLQYEDFATEQWEVECIEADLIDEGYANYDDNELPSPVRVVYNDNYFGFIDVVLESEYAWDELPAEFDEATDFHFVLYRSPARD